jgi:hypothetical protein|tara:strand:+ start:66 stop:305 length:240 start_codon:yes stop_codon:yes gene_type:complete
MSEFNIKDKNTNELLDNLTEDQRRGVANQLQNSLDNVKQLIELYDNGKYKEFLEGVDKLSPAELPMVLELVEEAKSKVE